MRRQEVQFIGGPLDGLLYPLCDPPDRLPAEVWLPVNPSLLKFMVMGNGPGQVGGPTTSIAVYRREDDEDDDRVLRYSHLISLAEGEPGAEGKGAMAPGLHAGREESLRRATPVRLRSEGGLHGLEATAPSGRAGRSRRGTRRADLLDGVVTAGLVLMLMLFVFLIMFLMIILQSAVFGPAG